MFLHTKQLYRIVILSGLFLAGCKEEAVKPLPAPGIGTPAPVSNVQVENRHGGAKITYAVPADPSLLYIEATWLSRGTARNTKVSYYSDTLTLEGFGDTSVYQVKVCSVNKNEERSAPVTVSVKPLTPPILDVFSSLRVKADFGGLNVSYLNETRSNVVIKVITADSTGKLVEAGAAYTSRYNDSFSVRGFDATPRSFGVFVKDRWDNYSDTLYTTLTPYFEAQLNKSLFREVNPYPGDVNEKIYSASYPMNKLWDNSPTTIFVTANGLGMPESFTIDLGVSARLSRMKYYQRQSTAFYYTSQTPMVFDVYGSNSPASNGDWNSWTLLTHCVSAKPSGLPLGVVNSDDVAAAVAGEDFNFPITSQGYRYLRFKVTQTYGNASSITFAELSFWGAF
jgi:hypothetical protein